jgi:hypothetical protein
MMTPEEGGGILDTIGGIVGAIPRAIGAITPQETDALQGLKRLQSQRVLGEQILQKGPQTESDAARMALTTVSPMKSKVVNEEVIRTGKAASERDQAKSVFYTAWANKYGLNGVSPEGLTADEVWGQVANSITDRVRGRTKTVSESLTNRRRAANPGAGNTSIKIISRKKI